MHTKLIYSAPIAVRDSLGEPVNDQATLTALADISCLDGTVLDFLATDFPDQAAFRGGYLRLFQDGKKLRLRIEIDSPRRLTHSELAELRQSLDGQVSDGIGSSAFNFVGTATDLSIETFPNLLTDGEDGTLVQEAGAAWRPNNLDVEKAANLRRCQAALAAANTFEEANEAKRRRFNSAARDPRKLFKLIQKGNSYPRPENIERQISAEIARLGGDLSFIASHQLPYARLNDPVLLKLLLDAKLNPNLHDCDGHTLLALAVPELACVKLLLERGADVNLRDTRVFRSTALMEAARLGEVEIVQLLLDDGADPSLQTFFEETALDAARNNEDQGNPAATIRALEQAMREKK